MKGSEDRVFFLGSGAGSFSVSVSVLDNFVPKAVQDLGTEEDAKLPLCVPPDCEVRRVRLPGRGLGSQWLLGGQGLATHGGEEDWDMVGHFGPSKGRRGLLGMGEALLSLPGEQAFGHIVTCNRRDDSKNVRNDAISRSSIQVWMCEG